MRLLIWFCLTVLVVSCAKEEIDQNDYDTNPENGLVVRKAEGEVRSEVVYDMNMEKYVFSVNENEISISSLYPFSNKLEIGQTLVFGITEHTPEGLIAKITDVDSTEDKIVIKYDNGTISDVFNSLDYDISYFNTNKGITKREFIIEKELFDKVAVEFEFTPATLDITPSFGMNFEFVGIFDVDFQKKTLGAMTFGYKNANIDAGFNAKILANANGTGSITSPDIILPPIQFLVAEIPVVINSKVAVKVSAGLEVSGGFDMDVTMKSNTFDAIIDIGTQYPLGYKQICAGKSPCDPDMDFDIKFNDLQGSAVLTLAKQYGFEFTMYNLYDVLTIGSGITVPEIEFGTEIKYENEQSKAIITGKAGFPLEFSFKTSILDILFDVFKSNGISTSFLITVPTKEFDLFNKEFTLPCNVNITNSLALAECTSVGDMVKLTHGLSAPNGSQEGYKLNVDGHEMGVFPYGIIHNTTFESNKMKYSGTVSMRDAESPGCRVELKVSNPCELISYCEDSPAIDVEGQEYCYQTMADGRKWFNSNLITSFGGTTGICHSQDPNACFAIGRYYQFDELGDDVCPLGWRIPTLQEWKDMLNWEAQSVGSTNNKVDHLLAPNLVNFGNVSPSEANGFNILPSGMYQGWKTDLPIADRFTESTFDQGIEQAYFWTSTDLEPGESSNEFDGEGAWAILMRSSGQYSTKKMSKKAGLTCRCIKN